MRGERRSLNINMRVTESEKDLVRRMASQAGMEVTDYLITLAELDQKAGGKLITQARSAQLTAIQAKQLTLPDTVS